MADDSQVPFLVKSFPDGVIDCTPAAADIDTIGTAVYISGDREVTAIPADATEAVVRKKLGRTTKPFKTGLDVVVPVHSKYTRNEEFVAGGTVTAGEFVMYEYGTGAISGQVITWTPGTDDEDQIVGQCWFGGVDTGTVEILVE